MIETFLIAVSLAMDAFAVSVSSGISVPGFGWKHAVKMGAYFGFFQLAMPLLGWLLGSGVSQYIEAVDHWIAFGLLAFIGVGMIRESREQACPADRGFSPKEMLPLAVATSIDALAAGVSLALLDVQILWAVSFIGLTTFCLSAAGVWAGHRFGARYKGGAELAGGVVLILIGVKVLLEHLGLLSL